MADEPRWVRRLKGDADAIASFNAWLDEQRQVYVDHLIQGTTVDEECRARIAIYDELRREFEAEEREELTRARRRALAG